MKHSERFENAVTKLYNAFHEGELDYGWCKKCAVGNICNNQREWGDVFCGTVLWEPIIKQINMPNYIGKSKDVIDETGYSVIELATIEALFGNELKDDESIEYQFNGLCAVVKYLCELEGIENIMDYQSLFNPKRELELTQIF